MVTTRSQTATPTSTPSKSAAAVATSNGTAHANGSPMKKRKAPLDSDVGSLSKRPRDEKTDYARWRLREERGRQTWHYLESDDEAQKWPQSVADKYMLGLDTVCGIFCYHGG